MYWYNADLVLHELIFILLFVVAIRSWIRQRSLALMLQTIGSGLLVADVVVEWTFWAMGSARQLGVDALRAKLLVESILTLCGFGTFALGYWMEKRWITQAVTIGPVIDRAE